MAEKPSQSIKSDRISESSIMRAAGNIMSGLAKPGQDEADDSPRVERAVQLARAIAAEVQRTAVGKTVSMDVLTNLIAVWRERADGPIPADRALGMEQLASELEAVVRKHAV